jgi:hypothetical protein
MIKVIGIKVTDRLKEIGLTQEVLSRHSALITTRLGFHELTNEVCSREAYIILHLKGEPADSERLSAELGKIGGIEIQEMDFMTRTQEKREIKPGKTVLMGILVEQDHDTIVAVQKLLTSFGCIIRTRLGVNERFFGKPAGLIIVELTGDYHQMELFEKDIAIMKGVHLRKIVF